MTTQIFNSYEEFLEREHETINGVSPRFATANPDWEEMNATNEGCWNCLDCARCKDCKDCKHCEYCTDCDGCMDCYGCTDCKNCTNFEYCTSCYDCEHGKRCEGCVNCKECEWCMGCIGCKRCNHCVDCRYCVGEVGEVGIENGQTPSPQKDNPPLVEDESKHINEDKTMQLISREPGSFKMVCYFGIPVALTEPSYIVTGASGEVWVVPESSNLTFTSAGSPSGSGVRTSEGARLEAHVNLNGRDWRNTLRFYDTARTETPGAPAPKCACKKAHK